MWDEFIIVLTKILDLYKELLALNKEKRAAIVMVKMEELEKFVRQEQMMIATVGKMEQKRQAVLMRLLAAENITAPNKELLDLIAFCDKSTGEKIKEIHQDFQTTLDSLEKENKVNDYLIRQALSVVNYKLNVVSETAVAPTYASAGGEQVMSGAKRFEFKA